MNRREYNQKYYLRNREKILERAKEYYLKTKKPCPVCGKLISRTSKRCISCTLKERNKGIEQRSAVSSYWKGRSRDKWLKNWRLGNLKELAEEEVKDLSDEWLKLLGWILTDGYIDKKWAKVVIYQRKEKYKEKIRKILENLNLKWREYEAKDHDGKTTIAFYVISECSKTILEKLCLKEKTLPKWTKFLSKHQTMVLLDSLIDGDGHRDRYSTYLSGKLENLKPIYDLLKSKGFSCSLSENSRGDCYIYIHQGQLWTQSE